MSIFVAIKAKGLSDLSGEITIPHDFPPGFQQAVENCGEYRLFHTFFQVYDTTHAHFSQIYEYKCKIDHFHALTLFNTVVEGVDGNRQIIVCAGITYLAYIIVKRETMKYN